MGGRYSRLTAIAGLVVFLDQITKHLAITHLKDKDPVGLIRGFMMLRYTENPGSAWSIFADQPASFRAPFFIGVSILGIALVLYFYRKIGPKARLLGVALPLIFGGALGNLIDRVQLNLRVVDFISAYYRGFSWPIFNVADIAITTGEILLVLAFFTGEVSSVFPTEPSVEIPPPEGGPVEAPDAGAGAVDDGVRENGGDGK